VADSRQEALVLLSLLNKAVQLVVANLEVSLPYLGLVKALIGIVVPRGWLVHNLFDLIHPAYLAFVEMSILHISLSLIIVNLVVGTWR